MADILDAASSSFLPPLSWLFFSPGIESRASPMQSGHPLLGLANVLSRKKQFALFSVARIEDGIFLFSLNKLISVSFKFFLVPSSVWVVC